MTVPGDAQIKFERSDGVRDDNDVYLFDVSDIVLAGVAPDLPVGDVLA